MHGVEGGPLRGEVSGPVTAQRDLRSLHPRVGGDPVVSGRGRLQRRGVEPLRVHPAGGDCDDPRGRGGQKPRQHELCQQKRRDDLPGDREFDSGAVRAVVVVDRTRVVDEGIEALMRVEEFTGKGPNGVGVVQVRGRSLCGVSLAAAGAARVFL